MKVQNLLFVIYSNYSNRLIKPIGTYMTDYYTAGDDVLEVAKVSFHQGNGIYAEQVVTTDFSSFVYNYLLTSDNDDATLKVTTRWFVIGKEDLRNGQVRVSLKRDLISDYFNDVVSADFMMERGNLDFGAVGATADTRIPDPFVFLPEDQQYNQIKKGSVKLYRFNSREPAWIVGYVAKNIQGYQSVEIDPSVSTYGSHWGMDFSDSTIQINADDAFNVIAMPYKDCDFVYTSGGTTYRYANTKETSLQIMTGLAAKGILYDIQLVPYLPGLGDEMTIDSSGDVDCDVTNFASPNGSLDVNHCELMESGIYKGRYPGNLTCTHSASGIEIRINSTGWPIGGSISEVAFVSDTGATAVKDWTFVSGQITYSLKDNRLVLGTGLYTYSFTYPSITITNPAYLDELFNMMDEGLAHLEVTYKVSESPSIQPIIMSLAHSEGTFKFTRNMSVSLGGGSVPLTDLKLSKNTEVYRLVSPNHASIFEWSPAMNYTFYDNSGTTVFEANAFSYQIGIDLKPFDPYIRVQPQFRGDSYGSIYEQGLYGTNFYDGRGLICDGDFSLTMPSSAWESYKLNNKTFASAFSREITTLEKQKGFGVASDVMGAAGSTFAGALAGSKYGGIPGAVAGAVVGLGMGVYNTAKNATMRQEQIDKAKTQFQMNLQSIQARPDAIHKVGPIDPDNDIWPTVELYKATDTERAQFIKKMKMTGMIAHKATTISSQMTDTTIIYPLTVDNSTYQFFSGTIIRMPIDTKATPEMINEISSELETGVYFATSLF